MAGNADDDVKPAAAGDAAPAPPRVLNYRGGARVSRYSNFTFGAGVTWGCFYTPFAFVIWLVVLALLPKVHSSSDWEAIAPGIVLLGLPMIGAFYSRGGRGLAVGIAITSVILIFVIRGCIDSIFI